MHDRLKATQAPRLPSIGSVIVASLRQSVCAMAFPVTESAAATFVAGSWRLGEHSDEGPGGLLTGT